MSKNDLREKKNMTLKENQAIIIFLYLFLFKQNFFISHFLRINKREKNEKNMFKRIENERARERENWKIVKIFFPQESFPSHSSAKNVLSEKFIIAVCF